MSSQEDIADQQSILATYRQTLNSYLRQRAIFGDANTPPYIIHGIINARSEINRIKKVLRDWGMNIEDLPNEDSDPTSEYTTSTGPAQPRIILEEKDIVISEDRLIIKGEVFAIKDIKLVRLQNDESLIGFMIFLIALGLGSLLIGAIIYLNTPSYAIRNLSNDIAPFVIVGMIALFFGIIMIESSLKKHLSIKYNNNKESRIDSGDIEYLQKISDALIQVIIKQK